MPLPIHQKPSTRQFVKFCIVGFGNSLIYFGAFNLLYLKVHLPLIPSVSIAFFLSVLNAFIWHRRWTFRESRVNSAATQSVRFVLVNIVGWLLNTSIVVLIVAHQSAQHAHLSQIAYDFLAGKAKRQFGPLLLNEAAAVATFVGVFWNFFANRLWTFKHPKK